MLSNQEDEITKAYALLKKIARRKKEGLQMWSYVYILVDPRDGKPFYVGKGRGDRIDHHEVEAAHGLLSEKCERIRNIKAEGLPVVKNIVALFKESRKAQAQEVKLIHEHKATWTNGKWMKGCRL